MKNLSTGTYIKHSDDRLIINRTLNGTMMRSLTTVVTHPLVGSSPTAFQFLNDATHFCFTMKTLMCTSHYSLSVSSSEVLDKVSFSSFSSALYEGR